MKKSILHIKLPKRPPLGDSYGENKTNSCCLHDWTESLFIIKPILLLEALGYKTCLVALHGTISLALHLVNPFASHYVLVFGPRNKMPCVIF
jgi:hypothetical protein